MHTVKGQKNKVLLNLVFFFLNVYRYISVADNYTPDLRKKKKANDLKFKQFKQRYTGGDKISFHNGNVFDRKTTKQRLY